jgi:hypothetical protein
MNEQNKNMYVLNSFFSGCNKNIMKGVKIFLGFVLVLILIVSGEFVINYSNTSNHSYDSNVTKQNRCNPIIDEYSKVYATKHKDNNILLHKSSSHVRNKGFVNELIHKPESYTDEIEYQSSLIEEEYRTNLNDEDYKRSVDLPIANINVAYLLENNTTKLEK